jgi:hypothetical protein
MIPLGGSGASVCSLMPEAILRSRPQPWSAVTVYGVLHRSWHELRLRLVMVWLQSQAYIRSST